MSTIILIEDSSKSLFGGGQKISSIVLEQLQRFGKRVIYVDFVDNPKLKVYVDLRRSKVLKLYYKVLNFPFGTFLQLVLLIPNFFILTVTILNEKNPIVYATSKRGLIYGGVFALLFRVEYIYHAHMVMQGKLYDKLILFFIRNAHCCICVSEYVLLEFKKRGVKNCILLENPIERAEFKNSKSRKVGVFRVVFIGSVIEIKGINYLLDIFNIYSHSDI